MKLVTLQTFQGHVTSSVTWPFGSPYVISYWWSFGTKPLYLTVSEIFNVKFNAMVDVTLIRPLNKGQGHSFWYQSISHIQLPYALNSNFCFRTSRLATIHHVYRQTDDDDDRRNTVPIAQPLVRSAKNYQTNQLENWWQCWDHESRLPSAVVWRHHKSKIAEHRYVGIFQ